MMMSPRITPEVILIVFLICYGFIMKYYFAQGKSETFNKNSLILAAP